MYTTRLGCNKCKACAQPLSEVQMVMVEDIKGDKKRTGGLCITEASARVPAL